MLCFETYSQGVVGVGSTAAELEERVQSGGPQAGRPSGTDVSAGNVYRHRFIRKRLPVGERRHQSQHAGAVSAVAFLSKSTSSR